MTNSKPPEDLFNYLEGQGYANLRIIDGRGLCGLRRFMFTTGICEGLDEDGYTGRWCFETKEEAKIEFDKWDGKDNPGGEWIKYKGQNGEYSNPNLHL